MVDIAKGGLTLVEADEGDFKLDRHALAQFFATVLQNPQLGALDIHFQKVDPFNGIDGVQPRGVYGLGLQHPSEVIKAVEEAQGCW